MAKQLVADGKAYPCFLTSEEMEKIREEQSLAKRVTGIYGSYAAWRERTFEEYKSALESGKQYVIRFRTPAKF